MYVSATAGTRGLALALAGLAGCFLLAAPASASVQIGQTFVPAQGCSNRTMVQRSSVNNAYVVPSDGVLTSWTTEAGNPPQTVAFKLFRPRGGNQFEVIGSSAHHTPPAGGSFTGNLSYKAKAGDLIGLHGNEGPGTPKCYSIVAGSGSGWDMSFVDGEQFGTATYSAPDPGLGRQIDVSAILEPDADDDGLGDESQDGDDDNDGAQDTQDNCLGVANPDQANSDGAADGGDACDADDDDDGLSDASEVAAGSNPTQADSDGDGHRDFIDNCLLASNPTQEDFDQDGVGDACDPPARGKCVNVRTGMEVAETITGTIEGDRILALGGRDVVNGLSGDDCIDGGGEADRLSGGDGNDRLDGRGGADRLGGGSGRDRLSGGDDADAIKGGAGKNSYSGGDGGDAIRAANGNRETVDCGPGKDTVVADASDKLRRCERVSRRR